MRTILALFVTLAFLANTAASAASGFGLGFGKKDESASVKVDGGKVLKGKSTLALGAFRVAFVTSDSAYSESHGMFANGGSSAKISGELVGIDHATMQKIADKVYADFLKQAAAKGYTILDSTKVAAASSAYRNVTQTANYADSRIGTLVIPTGQRSVALAADDSGKDSKGAETMAGAFHNLGKITAKSDANKAFPAAAKDLDAPVLGVTIVVNFAGFKGTTSSFGSSKASVLPGATIDGMSKNDLALNTSVLAWDGSVCAAAVPCEARLYMQGYIHSDAPIGRTSSTKKGGFLVAQKKTATVDADPDLYEKAVMDVTNQASSMLLDAIQKER